MSRSTLALVVLTGCFLLAFISQAIAQTEILPEPSIKSMTFAGKDLLKKDAIYTVPRGVEFELEIHAELGSFSAFREDDILHVLGTRADGRKIILQMATYKIKRFPKEEVVKAKIKIPELTPAYAAKLQVMQKNKVLIQRDISITTEK